MWKIILGTSLLTALCASGCSNSRLHQSLLTHENRQLEYALYEAYAQLDDLQRENEILRGQQFNGHRVVPGSARPDSWDDDRDTFPPLEAPKVILPSESGTSEVPDFLRGSQTTPTWSPRR